MSKKRVTLNIAVALLYILGLILNPLVTSPRQAKAAPPYLSEALVLVNFNSPSYLDFQHYIEPYLDHFGFPYTVLNIETDSVGENIGDYAVIIIGHRELDVGGVYLNDTEEGYISSAVIAGTGLVNFDNDLSADGITPRYRYVDDVFGFGYGATTSGAGVTFPSPDTHYITDRHEPGESISTGTMTLSGITLPLNMTAVVSSGSQPFLAITDDVTGRAVQWGSYDWMSHSVKGPIYGLDDLVWRSIVWAARKPFVMQGMPPFLTMRVDDESGPFNWIHIANEYGYKPWAGLFYHNISDTEAADLSVLVNSGQATAAVHAKSGTFFYFNHGAGTDFSDEQIATNFTEATAWHSDNDIPISQFVLPHYYEFGKNVFQGLSDWGVEFVGTQMDPGNGYGAPWIKNGPYRLTENGGSSSGFPMFYADFMTIPDHPEFDGQFFNCVTEIRDDAGYEWYPNLSDIPGTIGKGTRQTKRALDSMALATLFTHGYYVAGDVVLYPDNWRAILDGINTNLSDYEPIYVTMDYACHYVRATRTSYIDAASYDPETNQITTTFDGLTDLETKFYVFMDGEGYVMVDVPIVSGPTSVPYTIPGPLDHILVTPNPASVVAGASIQLSAVGFDSEDNIIPNISFDWSVIHSGGTIDNDGHFTAGVTPGSFADTVMASRNGIEGFASIEVIEPILDHFEFAPISSPKFVDLPFSVTITARDPAGYLVLGYVGSADLSDSTGTVEPSLVGPFEGGVWTGPVTIGAEATDMTLTVVDDDVTGASNTFDVATLGPGPFTIWDGTIPTSAYAGDANAVELGVRFQAASDGYIMGLRFWKDIGNSGTHVGHLWTADGTLLAEATFTGETASGWQEVTLSEPVPIQADTTYVASYHTATGYNAARNYFSGSGYDNPPLRALADGDGGGNGVYCYDSDSCTYPVNTYQSSNYWVDVMFLTQAGPDETPPTVASTSPEAGVSSVAPDTYIEAQFSEAMDQATINGDTFELRDASDTPVAGVITYDAGTRTAIFDPDADMAYESAYSAIVTTGVTDLAGNPMAGDHDWSFTTAAPPPLPPNEGPGGPILIIADAGDPFGRYFAEILRTEGLNTFTVTDVSLVDASILADYDVVILGEMALSAAQVTLLSDWVDAGGNLIAMRPDKQLAGLLGLTDATATLSEGYLLIDTTSGPGEGLVGETIQFHGTADLYTLDGATALATLYSDATTATPNPSVTLHSVGTNGGQAAAFVYDLARSVVYTRQGNPDWEGQNRDDVYDGQDIVRPDDMFFGNAPGDPQTDWIDLNKVAIPQADEQQRLLANLILDINLDRMPLPRFWYFPRGEKAVVIMTGDDHGSSGTDDRFNTYIAQSPAGCSVEDWECVRASSYVYTNNAMIDAQAAAYDAQGFEVGLHVNTGCSNWSPASLESAYASQLAAWQAKYPSLPVPSSERTHCIVWSDWATHASVELVYGSHLDTNYYYWPPGWILNRPGMFTGSGMPMRFADLEGTMIDVYQATTQMTDESGQTYPYTIDALLDKAIGPEGYYGAFTANMHTDHASHAGSDAIVASALARDVPVVSGRQMLQWLDGRNASSFGSLSWSGNTLSFSVAVGSGANGLQVLMPTQSAVGELTGITFEGSPISYGTETIKGIRYAIFLADAGVYEAVYAVDTTAPAISAVTATPGGDGTALITWNTNEAADSRVDYGIDPAALTLNVADAALVSAHSIILAGLDPATTYYYRVTSDDAASNSATWPPVGDPPASFNTPAAAFVDTTLADFGSGTVGICAVVETDDGEIILAPYVGTEFNGTSLPAGWTSTPWSGGVGTSVSGGIATVDGAFLYTPATTPYYGPNRSIEFVATFTGGSTGGSQHIGFGTDLNGAPWAIFSTGWPGSTTLIARSFATTQINTVLPSIMLGEPHLFRIEWLESETIFFVDGVEVARHAVSITNPMRVVASDQAGGPNITLDWMRMSPYASPCTFDSRIFDAGEPVNWESIAWTTDMPAGTSLNLSYRIGDTPVPDGSWTDLIPLGSSPTALAGSSQYIQYQAELATTDDTFTPVLEDMTITYNAEADTTPPTIIDRSPAPDATEVARDASVVVTFSEPMDATTVSDATFRLRANGAGSDVPSVVTYGGTSATLDPVDSLEPGTLYHVTVADSVTDLAGNPLGADDTWSFTTTALAAFTDTTELDFGAGSGTCVVDSTIGDGALRLPATVDEDFGGLTLPDGWVGAPWPGSDGSVVVSNGQLVVNQARAYIDNAFNLVPGQVLEFVATFEPEIYQHVGFVSNADFAAPWIIFSTRNTTTNLYARTNPGNDGFLIPGDWIGEPHLYRIEWLADRVDFYIDGILRHSEAVAISGPLGLIVSDFNSPVYTLNVDWMRLMPYLSPCTFESRVFDAGEPVNWQSMFWNADTPAGTGVILSYRIGDTEIPDASWNEFAPVGASPPASLTGNSRYIQYQAELTTSDGTLTPILLDVMLTYAFGGPEPPYYAVTSDSYDQVVDVPFLVTVTAYQGTTINLWEDEHQDPVLATTTSVADLVETDGEWTEFFYTAGRDYPSILAGVDEDDYGLPVMHFFAEDIPNGEYEVIANLYTSGLGRDMRYFYGFTSDNPKAHYVDTVGGAGGSDQHEEYSLGTVSVTDWSFDLYVHDADLLGGTYPFFGWAWIRLVPIEESEMQINLWEDDHQDPVLVTTSNLADLSATDGQWTEFLWTSSRWFPGIFAAVNEYEDYSLPMMKFHAEGISNGEYQVIANLYDNASIRYFYGFTPDSAFDSWIDVPGGASGTQFREYNLGNVTISDGAFSLYVQDAALLGGTYPFFGWAWIRLVPAEAEMTISSSSSTMLFDGDGDGTFGEPSDEVKSLVDGTLDIMALDSTSGTEIEIRAEDAAGRYGLNLYNIAANLPPVADAGGPYSGDEGSPIALDGSGSTDDGIILLYEWDCEDNGTYDISSSSPTGNSCTYLDDGPFTVRLRVTDDGDPALTNEDTAPITVLDLGPTAAFTWAPEPHDEGAAVQFTDESTSSPDEIDTWSWDFAGLGTSTLQNPSFTFMDDGLYEVCLIVTDDDGTTDTICHTITILDLGPTAAFSWSAEPQDEGSSVSFTDESTSYPDDIVAWSWDFAGLGTSTDQNPSFTFMDDGEYLVCLTVTDDDGSTDEACHTITIDDLGPTADFAWSPEPQDEGAAVAFTNLSTSYPDDIVSWSWDFDGLGTSTLQNPSFTFMDDGSYDVCLTVTDDDGTTDTVCHTITILDLGPTAAFTWAPEPQDEGALVQFTDASISYPDDIVSWSWDFGGSGTSNAQNPSFTFMDNVTYNVCLTITDDDGSIDEVCHTITILDLGPTAAFTWAPEPQDEGSAVQFTDASTSSPDEIVAWSWDFGGLGTSTLQNPSFTFMDDGTYNVCLTVTDDDGSTNEVCHTITVTDLDPTAAFSWAPEPQDEGTAVQFTDASNSYPDSIVAWSWDFAGLGSSIAQNPSFTFMDDGIYDVCLTVTDDNGSTDTVCHDVTILDLAPTAEFTWDPEPQDEGSTVNFTDQSSSDPDDIASWSWDFAGLGTSAAQHPSFTFMDDGTYDVCLTVTDDDETTATACHTITISDLAPTAAFTWAPEPQDEGAAVAFMDLSTSFPDDIVAWSWDFAGLGTSTLQNPSFTFMDDGSYNVCLTVTDDDGTSDIVCHMVAVVDLGPTAAFSWAPEPQDEGTAVQFTDASTSYPDSIVAWSWDFAGLGSSSDQSPSFTFMDDGLYDVCLTVTDDDGTTDSVCHMVAVVDLGPTAAFSWAPEPQDEGSVVQFTDASTSSPDGIVTWNWDFAGLGTSALQNPTFTFMDDGSYDVCLTVTDDDGTIDSECHTVTVDNVVPTLTLSGDASVDEGSLYTLTLSEVTDPGADTVTVCTVDWGDGSSDDCLTTIDGSLMHTYADGPNDYTISVDLMDEDGTYEDVDTLDISVNNAAPTVTVDPSSQTVQYSDYIVDVIFTTTDVAADVLTVSTSALPDSLTLTDEDCDVSVDGFWQTCTWTLEGTMDVPVGDYEVTVTVTDEDGDSNSADTSITVEPEDATVEFDSDNPVAVQVASPDGPSGLFELIVFVSEAYDNVGQVEPNGEPYTFPGDIGNAQTSVALVPVGPGGSVAGSCVPGDVVDSGYDAVLPVTCSFDEVPVNTYTVQVTVDGGYYSGSGEDVLVVYDPSLGFATGGGWFYWPESNDKTNFGFTMKYNKKGTKVQGSLLLIRHLADGTIYRVKSNALYGLALGEGTVTDGEIFGWASFAGKSTYLEPGWPEPIGNHEFLVYVEDHNEPGTGVDRFWVEVHDKDGNVIPVMSMPVPATNTDNSQALVGGNIVVPHGVRDPKK